MLISEVITSIISYLFFATIVFAIVIILFERRNPSVTLTWLLLMLFVPVLGFILYIFLGQNLKRKKLFKLKEEEEREFDSVLRLQENYIDEREKTVRNHGLDNYLEMIELNLKAGGALFSADNVVELFYEGSLFFEKLIDKLENASSFIHIEYYIFRNDHLGRRIREVLCRKAREGIEVKLLFDGMGGIRLPRKFFKPLIDSGGEVACFFPPFLPYLNIRMNFRNHRKLCIIDGIDGFIGGSNIGDEYLGLSRRFGYWRDTDMHLRGSAVDGLEIRFLMDWRFASGKDILAQERYFPYRLQEGDCFLQIVSSGPDTKWDVIRDAYLKIINQAKSYVFIQTPYFVPDETMLDALRIAALSGVDVRLMVPEKKDHAFVHWASLSYLGELLEAGVRCYSYKKGFIHSKVIVSDAFASSVGTANFDIRSFKLNFEINAFIYDEGTSKELERKFLEDIADCKELVLDEYSKRDLGIRIKEAFSRLLSPIL